jgi:PGF-pre-PGF domain-containing protein
VDVTNPAAPAHAGSISDGGLVELDGPQSVFVSGNYAYVASLGSNALEIVDVTNPAAPAHAGSIVDGAGGAKLSWPTSVFVSGDYAYVTNFNTGTLEIVDITNKGAPAHAGSISNGGGAQLNSPRSVFVSGNYAYVASSGSSALEIVNVTDPTAPKHEGSIGHSAGGALLDSPYSVFVSGNYAYVVNVNGHSLEIVDITNKAAPVHAGSITDGAGGALLKAPLSVFVSGEYAYVASGTSNALEIVSVNTSTLSGNYVVDHGQANPLLNVASITAQNAVGLGGGTNISATLPGTNLANNVALTIIDPQGPAEPSDNSPPPTIVPSPGITTVNVGGNSAVGRVSVTGTGINDLIVTGHTVTDAFELLPPGIVYQYVDLVPARFTTITEATITFTVTVSWLEEHHLAPEDITMYHFTGSEWVALPTTVVSNANGVVSFTTKTNTFSIFAIAGVPKEKSTITTLTTVGTTASTPAITAPAQEPAIQKPVTQVSTVKQTTAAPGPVAEQLPGFPVTVIGIAGLGLIGGGVIFCRWWIRRQNPALFSEDE